MYSIFANNTLIYDDRLNDVKYTVLNPKLTFEENSAGSLEFTLPPTNIGYGVDGNNNPIIKRMDTDISVRRNGVEIWAGRVLQEDVDFWNNRKMFCEGELAFLNDSIQPPNEYTNRSVKQFLEALITYHNQSVNENRRFTVGNVTVSTSTANVVRYTNYEKTIDCIAEKLIEIYGGHLQVRKSGSTRYLDYYSDYPRTNTQTIEFGKNLMDFTRKWDMSNFCTVVVPLGKRLEQSPIPNLDAYLTVASVNGGSIYVQSASAVSAHGKIIKVVHWDEIENASELLQKAQQYLQDQQFDKMNLELSALDLHYLNVNVEAVKLLDQIRVISTPHGLDRLFPVTKLEIPLNEPQNTKFTLGLEDISSLTSAIKNSNANLIYKIEELPKEEVILTKAENKATEIAQDKVDKRTRGYITITQDSNGSDAMYVTNQQSVTASTKGWKWDLNGLSFATKSAGSETWNTPLVAMNMDGSIVADRITTGTLKSQNNNFSLNLNDGTMTMKKGSINIGNNAFKVDTDGSVTITKGSLSIGANDNFKVTSTGQVTIKDGSIDINSGTFAVTTNGIVTATNGHIGGFSIHDGYLYGSGLTIRPTGEIQFILYDESDVKYLGATTPYAIGIGAGNGSSAHDEARGVISGVWADGDIIAWIGDGNGSPIDNLKLTYVKNAPLWDPDNPEYTKYQVANRIYFGCNIDGDDHTAYNLRLDANTSGAFGVALNGQYIVGGTKMYFMHGFGIMTEDINAVNHRTVFRGQSLGSSVTTDQKKAIWNGTFYNMYIGDYWTINGINWVIVDMNYWYNTAGTAFTKHHLVIMPETDLYKSKMNDTNVNDTGYAGSKMFTTNLNNAKTTINSAFPNLVLTRADYLVKTVNSSGLNSAADWYNCTVDIPSETMIYGSRILGNQNATSLAFFGINYRQLAFFRLNPKLVTRSAMWLRDPVSTNRFCALSATGAVASYGSSGEYGVRPIFAMGPSSDPS